MCKNATTIYLFFSLIFLLCLIHWKFLNSFHLIPLLSCCCRRLTPYTEVLSVPVINPELYAVTEKSLPDKCWLSLIKKVRSTFAPELLYHKYLLNKFAALTGLHEVEVVSKGKVSGTQVIALKNLFILWVELTFLLSHKKELKSSTEIGFQSHWLNNPLETRWAVSVIPLIVILYFEMWL